MATIVDIGRMLDTMIEDAVDYGHIVWPVGKNHNDTPRYALFKIERVDGEIIVKKETHANLSDRQS